MRVGQGTACCDTHDTERQSVNTRHNQQRPPSGPQTTSPTSPAGVGQQKICGGHGQGETPGPIPNPEAKTLHGDGTAPDRVWESSTPPQHTYTKARWGRAQLPHRAFPISTPTFIPQAHARTHQERHSSSSHKPATTQTCERGRCRQCQRKSCVGYVKGTADQNTGSSLLCGYFLQCLPPTPGFPSNSQGP